MYRRALLCCLRAAGRGGDEPGFHSQVELPGLGLAPMMATPRVEIAALERRGERGAAALLARCFRDNPLEVAVIGGGAARRERSLRASMQTLLPPARRHGVVRAAHAEQELVGVCLGTAPGGFPLPPPEALRWLWGRLRQGPAVARRWDRVYARLAPEHPAAPHGYLGALAVDPGWRRRGVGAALLGAWLARVRADRHPVYLETARRDTLGFYGRAGFAVCGELRLFGVRVWRLRRPPGAEG